MVLNCQDVWRELSNYLDQDISVQMRAELEQHLAHCRHCAALIDSTRNVLVLVADERTFPLPLGFRERLHERLRVDIES